MTETHRPPRGTEGARFHPARHRGRRVLYDVLKAETLEDPTPTIQIFSRADIAALIGPGDNEFVGPCEEAPRMGQGSEDQVWSDTLRRIADDPRGERRPILRADKAMEQDIVARTAVSPHFAVVTDLISRAIALSCMSGQRLTFPPLLLLGSPGIGKTYYAKTITAALGTGFVSMAMNLMCDRGQLSGTNRSWKAARMGALAKGLLACPTAAPVFFLDEVDKITDVARDQPYNALLSALEEENARSFNDDYLEISLRLDHALWIMTANETRPIPEPILDRMMVLNVPDPSPDQARTILTNIYKEVIRPYASLFPETLEVDVIEQLIGMNIRSAKRLLTLALGFAAKDGRSRVEERDIATADLLNRGEVRHPVGFLR